MEGGNPCPAALKSSSGGAPCIGKGRNRLRDGVGIIGKYGRIRFADRAGAPTGLSRFASQAKPLIDFRGACPVVPSKRAAGGFLDADRLAGLDAAGDFRLFGLVVRADFAEGSRLPTALRVLADEAKEIGSPQRTHE